MSRKANAVKTLYRIGRIDFSGGAGGHQKPEQTENDGFMNIPEGIDEELPFD